MAGLAMNVRNKNPDLKHLRFLFVPYELDYWYDRALPEAAELTATAAHTFR
jgi:hypothetical protein